MERRNFLKAIPAAALIPLAAKANTKGNEEDPKAILIREQYGPSEPYGPFDYRGFHVYWTGWKSTVDGTRQAGQWIAYPLAPVWEALARAGCRQEDAPKFGIYASCPGAEGVYYMGDTLDISTHEGQELICLTTPKTIKDQEKTKGFYRLYKLIDEAWAELDGFEDIHRRVRESFFAYTPRLARLRS